MRASPRISVRGESGDPCKLCGPENCNFFLEMVSPFTEGCCCVWARQWCQIGPGTPSCCSRRQSFLETYYSRKMGPASSWLFPQNSFCKYCNSFRRTYYSIRKHTLFWHFERVFNFDLNHQSTQFQKFNQEKGGWSKHYGQTNGQTEEY